MKTWKKHGAGTGLALLALVGYYFHWQGQAEEYKTSVLEMLDAVETHSNGAVHVTMEEAKVTGFPATPQVRLIHSSFLSDLPGKEHLEVHSHDIAISRHATEQGVRHNITWLEPAKVIYGNGRYKFTYKVKQKEPFVTHVATNAASNPETLHAYLPKKIELTASCGENEKKIGFDMPLLRGMAEFHIPTDLHASLRTFVYMIDEALQGKGGCSSEAKAKAHQH